MTNGNTAALALVISLLVLGAANVRTLEATTQVIGPAQVLPESRDDAGIDFPVVETHECFGETMAACGTVAVLEHPPAMLAAGGDGSSGGGGSGGGGSGDGGSDDHDRVLLEFALAAGTPQVDGAHAPLDSIVSGGTVVITADHLSFGLAPLIERLGPVAEPVIGVSPRGRGDAVPDAGCPTAAVNTSPFESLFESCAALHEDAGVDMIGFTPTAWAHDLRAVREALGVDHWHVVVDRPSFDVGHAVRALAQVDGAAVDSLVIVDPDLGQGDPALVEAGMAEVTRVVVAACASDPACADRFPDVVQDLSDLGAHAEGVDYATDPLTRHFLDDVSVGPVDDVDHRVWYRLGLGIHRFDALDVLPLAAAEAASGRASLARSLPETWPQRWTLADLAALCVDPYRSEHTPVHDVATLCGDQGVERARSMAADARTGLETSSTIDLDVAVLVGEHDPRYPSSRRDDLGDLQIVSWPAARWSDNECTRSVIPRFQHDGTIAGCVDETEISFAVERASTSDLVAEQLHFDYAEVSVSLAVPGDWTAEPDWPEYHRNWRTIDPTSLSVDVWLDTHPEDVLVDLELEYLGDEDPVPLSLGRVGGADWTGTIYGRDMVATAVAAAAFDDRTVVVSLTTLSDETDELVESVMLPILARVSVNE